MAPPPPRRPALENRHSYVAVLPSESSVGPIRDPTLGVDFQDPFQTAPLKSSRKRAYTAPINPLSRSGPTIPFNLEIPLRDLVPPAAHGEPYGEAQSHSPGPPQPTLLDSLLERGGVDLDAYGITEYRDGFFDALFFKPTEIDQAEMLKNAQSALPEEFERRHHPLSLKDFIPRHWHGIRGGFQRISSTRTGVRLAKTFIATFGSYLVCLVPTTHEWLGRYSFYMVLSTVINHPSRTVGAQLEGAVLTTVGTIAGLGWGALGLLLSTSTPTARQGYGGILALFVALFMGIISVIRSSYIRLYQLVLCAGIAATYVCLSEVDGKDVEWAKLYAHGLPWILGQVISLFINLVFFPDAGARPIAIALHATFGVITDGLALGHKKKAKLKRRLADTFVDLDQAYRDLAIEITIGRFYDGDIKELVDLLQCVIQSLISFETNEGLIDMMDGVASRAETSDSTAPTECAPADCASPECAEKVDTRARLVMDGMTEPTQALIRCMKKCVTRSDAIIMDLSGYRKYLGPPEVVPNDIENSLKELREVMSAFDAAEGSLLERIIPGRKRADLPEVVKLFVFCRPVRQAAANVEALSVKINEMKGLGRHYPSVHPPTCSFWNSLDRTNAQVRHDRGGVTAGSYYKSFSQIAGAIKKWNKSELRAPKPLAEDHFGGGAEHADLENPIFLDKTRFRYKLWRFLHRFQGFEARYAFKMIVLTGILSIPAWIKTNRREWWNRYNCWWMVAMAWIMMHPRVGGNFQDLFTRCFFAVFGSFWGVLAYTSGNGNPVVMAVFAAVYLVPMLYRFAQSSHPRSGIVGIISFIVVSLTAYDAQGDPPALLVGINTGLSIVVGTTAAIIVNWVLWPFVARHEVRKAIATMLFYMSVLYRSVVAKYVYYEGSHGPDPEDIERSEKVEGLLREGFVRIRQLLLLTRHEIRLRGEFDPRPYAALVDSCERFFQYLVGVRQASQLYEGSGGTEDKEAAGELLSYRRDAVAAVLSNLYILSGALRWGRKVPRYLPSAPAARKRLLEKLDEISNSASSSFDANSFGFKIPTPEVGGEKDYLHSPHHQPHHQPPHQPPPQPPHQPPQPHHQPHQPHQPHHTHHPHIPGSIPDEPAAVRRRRKAQAYDYLYHQSLTGCVAQLEELEKYTKAIVGEQGFDDIFHDPYASTTMEEEEDLKESRGRAGG